MYRKYGNLLPKIVVKIKSYLFISFLLIFKINHEMFDFKKLFKLLTLIGRYMFIKISTKYSKSAGNKTTYIYLRISLTI